MNWLNLLYMNWTDSLGKHPAPVQEFLLDRVGPDKQKSQEREDFGRKFVAMLKTWWVLWSFQLGRRWMTVRQGPAVCKENVRSSAFGQTIVESWRLGILWYVGCLCEGYTLQICWTRCSWDPYQMTFPQFSKNLCQGGKGKLQISTCPMMLSSLWGTWSW